jgi:hypothetical protein
MARRAARARRRTTVEPRYGRTDAIDGSRAQAWGMSSGARTRQHRHCQNVRKGWRAEPQRAKHRARWLRRLIFGDWHPLLRDPLDLLRLAFAVAAVLAFVAGHPDQGVRLAFSFIVVVAAARLNMPRVFDLLFILGWGAQAWGNAVDLFSLNVCTHIRVGKANFACVGYDDYVHFVLPLTSVAPLYVLGLRLDVLPDISQETKWRRRLGTVLFAGLSCTAIATLNEIWEYVAVNWLNQPLQIGYSDTIFDLTLGVLGSVAGGVLIWVWAARRWPTQRSPGVQDTKA